MKERKKMGWRETEKNISETSRMKDSKSIMLRKDKNTKWKRKNTRKEDNSLRTLRRQEGVTEMEGYV